MLHLVLGGNSGGYFSALIKTFTLDQQKTAPSSSAFSALRKRVSFRFVEHAFQRLLERCQARALCWKGLQIVAIDGMNLILPRTQDLVNKGFSGRKTTRYEESYMPRGYMTLAFDVLSGIILNKTFNPLLNEIADAISMIDSFSKQTLFVYDRLYFCKKLLLTHKAHGSYFVARLRRNASREVMSFFSSKRRFHAVSIHGVDLFLIKVKTPKGTNVFATNLPRHLFTRQEITDIYKLRWQVETAFLDLSTSCHLEKWHSKTYNGIMQELYMRLWIFNATRLLTGACQVFAKVGMTQYQRANHRVIMYYVAGDLHRYWRNFSRLLPRVKQLVKATSQTRIAYKRDNPRVIKSPRSPYEYSSTEWQWDKKWALS
jgi:hypothetical protein